ncbi:MAG: alpha/beta fold hydrolase [Bryobacteraceae bacterium]|nr:alpha/beta fold hydrolase [Bryobacteraceae bacterium]MDW8377177.1 alpha/beta fold hydrolase [Bryobacterales bacterium]
MQGRLLTAVLSVWLASVLLSAGLAHKALYLPPAFRPRAEPALAGQLARWGRGWEPAEVLSTDGARLKGWYFPASGPDAVILLHGVADSRRGMSSYARMLLQNGYSVLVPDSRGHGESGGEPLSYGWRERHDVVRWVDWLEQRCHPRGIFGLGVSMGAAILLQTLPLEPRIRAAVAEAPFVTFREVAYHRLAQASGLPGPLSFALSTILVEQAFLYTKIRFGIDLAAVSPRKAVIESATPVLFIHGLQDTNIPPAHSVELARLRGSKLWLAPGAQHVQVLAVAPAEYQRRVLEHFAQSTP